MEYIIGKNLLDILEENPKFVSEKQVTRWAIQLCDVLNYIHSYEPPIIYRDMKPSNIIYNSNLKRLYLIDFGTARFVAALRASGVTAIGTMGYAPPELFEGSVGPETDIYSLAATLIHLLVGSFPPFHPYYGFNFDENPHPYELNPKVSKNISDILVRAVSIEPESRYNSAKEMQKELKEHLANMW
jgi:serine/threonine-protein kinase